MNPENTETLQQNIPEKYFKDAKIQGHRETEIPWLFGCKVTWFPGCKMRGGNITRNAPPPYRATRNRKTVEKRFRLTSLPSIPDAQTTNQPCNHATSPHRTAARCFPGDNDNSTTASLKHGDKATGNKGFTVPLPAGQPDNPFLRVPATRRPENRALLFIKV